MKENLASIFFILIARSHSGIRNHCTAVAKHDGGAIIIEKGRLLYKASADKDSNITIFLLSVYLGEDSRHKTKQVEQLSRTRANNLLSRVQRLGIDIEEFLEF